MLGTLEDGRIVLEEFSRFSNTPIRDGERMYWNIPALLDGIRAGLSKAGALGQTINSVSADAWGVDYVLLDEAGEIMEPVYHYRDPRTAEGEKNVLTRVDWPTLFEETGIQYMPLNTSIQLGAENPGRLTKAGLLLTIADAFNYLLCGIGKVEMSMASTTQLYNPRTNVWSDRLIDALGFPRSIFPEVAAPATTLGPLKSGLAAETGLSKLNVVSSLSHDTACAVAAGPAEGARWAYISSGTWSLMGLEIPEPIITDVCRELNFTNEIGYGNTVRLLRNCIGMWLLSECRRIWAEEGKEYDYAALTQIAEESQPFTSLINPEDKRFFNPDNMPSAIAEFCRETNQPEPNAHGATVRCVLESLALLYAQRLKEAEELTSQSIKRLHIVGGGSRNALLNQFTSNACGVEVITGPTEATALGNVLVQAITLGDLPDLASARQVVAHSMDVESFQPEDSAVWEAAIKRFKELT